MRSPLLPGDSVDLRQHLHLLCSETELLQHPHQPVTMTQDSVLVWVTQRGHTSWVPVQQRQDTVLASARQTQVEDPVLVLVRYRLDTLSWSESMIK